MSLFVFPNQIAFLGSVVVPGAKLTFTATGTTTPQNTYTDIGLTVASSNPVVADANGVFAPIYLDPSLPAYRVKLTTSADVLVKQVDNVPSGESTFQNVRMKSTAPEIIFEETDAVDPNSGKYSIRAQTQELTVDLLNNAESIRTGVVRISRTGTSAALLSLMSGSSGVLHLIPGGVNATITALSGGTGIFSYKGSEIAIIGAQAFTGTFTGTTSVSPTIQCTYHIIGSPDGNAVAVVTIPAFTATSNATTFTITGVPAAVTPVTGTLQCCVITDSGADAFGIAKILAGASTITFGKGATAGNFTNSGTKGIAGEYLQLIWTIAT